MSHSFNFKRKVKQKRFDNEKYSDQKTAESKTIFTD